MKKRAAISAETSAEKAAKAVMPDVDSIKGVPKAEEKVKKVHFKRIKQFNEKRNANTTKYPKFNAFLLLIFPVFICFMAEVNQGKYFSSFFKFAAERPTVILFDILITAVLFAFLISLFKKGWIAILVHSFIRPNFSNTVRTETTSYYLT